VPIAFGVGLFVGVIRLSMECISALKGEMADPSFMGLPTSAFGVLLVAAIPFFGFLIFVLFYLGIEVTRAILSVPGKLDKLGK